jgi:DnaJ-class molecular chaperone
MSNRFVPYRTSHRRPLNNQISAIERQVQCSLCKGSGKITVSVQYYPSPEVEHIVSPCNACSGTGSTSVAQDTHLMQMKNAWCSCSNFSLKNLVFQENMAICKKCRKLVQYG